MKITANAKAGCGLERVGILTFEATRERDCGHRTRPGAKRYAPNPNSEVLFLVNRSRRRHARIEFDLAESRFVTRHILLQEPQQRLRLLWAEIDSLEIADVHLRLGLLLQGPKYQKKVPDIHAHLHAIGVILTVGGVVRQLDIGLRRNIHGWKCNRLKREE